MSIIREVGPNYPAPMPGVDIVGLDAEVRAAWDEARASLGAGAPTASEYLCRRILIHIAAGIEGAPEKMTFEQAMDFLMASGTAGMRKWVGKIHENGNDAAHELRQVPMERAKLTLEFTQRLLQAVYETKGRLEELRQRAVTPWLSKTAP